MNQKIYVIYIRHIASVCRKYDGNTGSSGAGKEVI